MWRAPFSRSQLPALARRARGKPELSTTSRSSIHIESSRATEEPCQRFDGLTRDPHNASRTRHQTTPDSFTKPEQPLDAAREKPNNQSIRNPQLKIVRRDAVQTARPITKLDRKKKPTYTPARLLDTACRLYRGETELSACDIEAASFLASYSSARLPILTAQWMLHCNSDLEASVRSLLPDVSAWSTRFEPYTSKGYQRDDVLHWVWILTANDPDERVRRFLSDTRHKPSFILNHLLNDAYSGRAELLRPHSIYGIINYCTSLYEQFSRSSPQGETLAPDSRPLDSPDVVQGIIGRLLSHARRTQAQAVIPIANLAATYLEALTGPTERRLFELRCRTFNFMLQELSIPPAKKPYATAHHSWEAIRTLLQFSSTLEKPLIVERESYRGIRRVLLALQKSPGERDTTTTLKKTWPPYRLPRNGLEEAMEADEYYSRTVKAGLMMQDAGYAKEEYDIATDILGGLGPDGSPTIQTRANYPVRNGSDQSIWAAQVRATRSAEEAWQAFQHPPQPGMAPQTEVFHEMILKALANIVDPHHDNLPGDGRETFSHDTLNFSEFERARLAPPKVLQLTRHMEQSGVRLDERCLNVLLLRSASLDEAVEYVQRSSLSKAQQATVDCALRGTDVAFNSVADQIKEISQGTLLAVIRLLCRTRPGYGMPSHTIERAMRIARLGWTAGGCSNPAPWEFILEALARSRVLACGGDPQQNSQRALLLAGHVMKEAEASCGLTLHMLSSFARVTQKVLHTRLDGLLDSLTGGTTHGDDAALLSFFVTGPPQGTTRRPHFHHWNRADPNLATTADLAAAALRRLRSAWADLASATTKGAASSSSAELGDTVVLAGASEVNTQMLALASLGDVNAMAALAAWTVRHADGILAATHAKRTTWLTGVLHTFRAFAEPLLDDDVVAPLRRAVVDARQRNRDRWLYWPSDDEVATFTQSDVSGRLGRLQDFVRLVAREREDGGGGDGGVLLEYRGELRPGADAVAQAEERASRRYVCRDKVEWRQTEGEKSRYRVVQGMRV
ncbi:hypothetical protein VD0002_g3416 [Verticillium dahliae]|uniref:Prefoldin subunit n=1 Tax=Verticillium dahliae TaxID=27337 RepID=A0AA44WKM0_VERDA|nr:hypothetical protein EV126DRAFT_522312 [Verticillium dahliae]PNH32450.1 hypothetical protein BJF96_g4161 [Verticillium dahliae]PNH48545.1 hypothetical protein VD0003_g8576 [Verticillium dahliae]PNH65709.1 hypothetical protein VD0002_g3416 [Verticillium dahliae]